VHTPDSSGLFSSPIDVQLTAAQRTLVERPLSGETLFLEGPAGAGKTTVGAGRLRYLLVQGIPAEEILVLTPQRTLLTPYLNTLRSASLPPGGAVDTLTVGGLARRMVELFWPLIAEGAGFAHPNRPPVFLTLETAQYYMARVADPFLERGAFDEVTIERNRLLSQILDNLNKAALIGIDYTQVGERLRSAWSGTSARATVFDYAQQCADLFRAHCLANNLLDFSLQIEVFIQQLLKRPWPPGESFFSRFTRYRHLIVDNIEEENPAAHDMLRRWLPNCQTALLILDQDAGYRIFLGADPESARELRTACDQQRQLNTSLVSSPDVRHLGYELARSLRRTPSRHDDDSGNLRQAIITSSEHLRFHPQMLDWVAEEIAHLVHEQNVSPDEIVIVAPYLSDALRFSLTERLTQRGVRSRSHRPSRALREEPATRCLLTLASLAHPEWDHLPLQADVAHALALSIETLDLVRAQLLTGNVYRPQNARTHHLDREPVKSPSNAHGAILGLFADLNAGVQERIGYQIGNRYDALREWLYSGGAAQRSAGGDVKETGIPSERTGPPHLGQQVDTPIDHFIGRLFGEVLSQPGFGFHRDFEAGRITSQLIESARKFRQVAEVPDGKDAPPTGLEYVRMVQRGVIAAQFVPAWGSDKDEKDTVLLAPAYTFLMRNRPVDYQFWLNIGSVGWWERPNQPLTHPYVLARSWQPGDVWTDTDESDAQTQALHRLVQGLLRRCRKQIYFGYTELGEHGYEQRGPLLQAIQQALRRTAAGG
jgi:hypothetical protein